MTQTSPTNGRLFTLPVLVPAVAQDHIGQATGAVAEHLLIAELLKRGHKVALPVVDDDGVDMIVNYSITVQVKSTTQKKKSALVAEFEQPRGRQKTRRPGLRAHVDVLAVYGRDLGTWWLIPRAAIGTRKRATVGGATALDVWRDAWDVFDPADPHRMS